MSYEAWVKYLKFYYFSSNGILKVFKTFICEFATFIFKYEYITTAVKFIYLLLVIV